MNPTRIRTVARRLAAGPKDRGAPPAADADLLARFLDRHDEAAFEELVARHLPAVRAVCRSLLRDPNDADDAVQATFLVLIRRAVAVRSRAALGGWLCRVAWRTANRLRGTNARRSGRHSAVEPDATPAPEAAPPGGELAEALHDEIGKLPERYRLAVLTCYAAGTPTAEAAARLGWPKGTLLTRLAWARKRLRDRLTRRGVTPAGAFAGLLGGSAGRVGAGLLTQRITRAAVALAAADPLLGELVSERVSSLTEGVVRAMIGTKLKVALGLGFLAVALLGLGLGRLTVGTADAANPGDKKPLPAAPTAQAKPAREENVRPEADPPRADPLIGAPAAPPAGPGNDLVVRRPLGSYTREVAPFGRGTLTFTENRLHIHATVNIEKFSVTVSADADYSINRESMVYGIITGVDMSTAGGGEAASALAPMAALATDLPFAFRVRVEDDAVTIKDIKIGPFGSPLFGELMGNGNDAKEMLLITSMVGGKYRADPHPDRNAPPAAAPRGNVPAPKFRRQQQPVLPPGGMSFSGPPPTAVPGSGLILPGAPPVGAPVVGGVVGPVPGTTAQPLPTGNPPVVSGPVPQQYPE